MLEEFNVTNVTSSVIGSENRNNGTHRHTDRQTTFFYRLFINSIELFLDYVQLEFEKSINFVIIMLLIMLLNYITTPHISGRVKYKIVMHSKELVALDSDCHNRFNINKATKRCKQNKFQKPHTTTISLE